MENVVPWFTDPATDSTSDSGSRCASGAPPSRSALAPLHHAVRAPRFLPRPSLTLLGMPSFVVASYAVPPSVPPASTREGDPCGVRLPDVLPIRCQISDSVCFFVAAFIFISAFLFHVAVGPAFSADSAAGSGAGIPGETLSVSVSAREPFQGDPVLAEVSVAPSSDNLTLVWRGRTVPMRDAGVGKHVALVGVDFMELPGKALLTATTVRNGSVVRFDLELTVRERIFPVQELTLPEGMARFDDAMLERIRGEAERLEERFAAVTAPAWDLPFLPPVPDFRPAGFGARRVINGGPRAPHAGVDIHVPAGTPVTAIAAASVAFAGEQFFGGNSVVLDHGGGVFSVYYHLREYTVVEGQRVARGQRIGSVGSSGRATGPHLHFGVRVPGGRVDPSRLFDPAFH